MGLRGDFLRKTPSCNLAQSDKLKLKPRRVQPGCQHSEHAGDTHTHTRTDVEAGRVTVGLSTVDSLQTTVTTGFWLRAQKTLHGSL